MDNDFDIAIVGMSCRFPGARNPEGFWKNLASGVESITSFSDGELTESGVPAGWRSSPAYVKVAPVLDEPGHFDAEFFGYSPGEARTIDPQHRVLLELAHEALEDAACDPQRYSGRIGVYTGSALNTYFTSVGLVSRLAENYIPTLIGNDKDFLSTRISYKLDLKGPSITIQTACSTSLVAIHLARQSLLTGESDVALAGAVSIRVPHRVGYFYDSGGVVSPDGHVRAFDARANGTVFGSGGGIVVLKRLADALADADRIHAVIKGSAVNNDGSEKAGYSAPSVAGQADAVVEALANAAAPADSISYVEAHGSGTPVGDPVEIRALTEAFRTSTQRRGFCAIGSVKTNIGHLDAAAGIAGLIKTVLAMKHRMLPASLNYSEANPEIDFPATPFFVNTELRDWASEGPRRAGVMSTGMGGTNAHVIVEEAPARAAAVPDDGAHHLLVLSAKTQSALENATRDLRSFLENAADVDMADVAFTLQIGRKALAHRRCLVCLDREDAIAGLGRDTSKRALSGVADGPRRPVVLLLPGVGDQYVGMGYELYETCNTFREEVDRCARILEPHLGIDIRAVLYPATGSWKRDRKARGIDLKKMLWRSAGGTQAPHADLDRTLFVQPALFTIEYSTSRMWQAFGVTPDAIVGHSLGEYVAACLAGVLSLEDALRLVATRARLVDALPRGAMLAVPLAESELLPLLPEELSISVLNGPRLAVVAGPAAAVTAFEEALNAKGVTCRRVQNGHAFHSKMLDPIATTLKQEASRVRLNAPTLPYISNVTGTWISASEACDPAYWALHATRTARFSDALHELWRLENPILLEAGPGRTLSLLALQHPERPQGGDAIAVSSVRHDYENQGDAEFLWNAIGRLWTAGVAIGWEKTPSRGRKVSLPTYPFERQLHWIEAPKVASEMPAHVPISGKRNFEEWFYVPVWRHAPPSGAPRHPDGSAFWLVFADRCGGGESVKEYLESAGCEVGFVRFADGFARRADGMFELNPAAIADYVRLFETLAAGVEPKAINIVHLGSVTRGREEDLGRCAAESQEFSFYSLLHIAQAIGDLNLSIPICIGAVSNRLHEVTGEERLAPEMATVLGPCGVIPKEFPNVKCFNIDLPDEEAIDSLPRRVLAMLVAEFDDPAAGETVAYRGRYRWRRDFERIPLAEAPLQSPGAAARSGRLRPNGVYVITGGTGGIGLSIAKYLAQACQPVIVLTKRTAFPEKAAWKDLSLTRQAPPRMLTTIDALIEIERCGARVEVHQADVTDRAGMENLLRSTRERYGAINGVIHAAGIVIAELIQSKSRATAHRVLAPKVQGTTILLDLIKDVPLDFLVLFSSITAVEMPYAHCDYSAANCFLDASTYAANARHRFHTLAINWPGWKEIGQLVDLETAVGLENWKKAALDRAISTRDGVEAFARALHSGLKQVIVCPEDLHEVLVRARMPLDPDQYLSPQHERAKSAAMRTVEAADVPGNEVEAALAEIWKEVLGLEQVGVHEPFSLLGGHSLLAMQIVSRVRASYEIRLGLREFFEASTIAGLSRVIQAKILAEVETIPDDEARELVSRQ